MGIHLYPDMRTLPDRLFPDQQPLEEQEIKTYEVSGVHALFSTLEYIKRVIENRSQDDEPTL